MAAGKNILIAEDEATLARVMKEKLELGGYKTVIAKDGTEVMPLVKSFKPDLILLDLIMPNKDGFAVLEELKKDPEYNIIPVIVLSNLGEDDNIKKTLRMGAVDYMVKAQHPLKEVLEKVEAALSKGR